MRLDAHQHFWHFDPVEYDWILEDQSVLRRDFLPNDLLHDASKQGVSGSIAVQARQSIAETKWLLELAQNNSIIKGVVGWIDLCSPNLKDQLNEYSNNSSLKGFRHVLQGEQDRNFMLRKEFIRGLKIIQEAGYCYDLLVYAFQLPEVLRLVEEVPELPMVVDHIAKPNIATGKGFSTWQQHISDLAKYPNIYCKISGMVTEADHNNWCQTDFDRYMETVFAAFGPERVMFGSDWPVCLLASDYEGVINILEQHVKLHYPMNLQDIFGLNARRFYQV